MAVVLLALALAFPSAVPGSTTAVRAADFLDSLGANSAVSRRGETLDKTIESAKYLGLRWLRSGYENDPPVADLIELHRRADVRLSWGFLSGGNDLPMLLATGKELAKAGALLAFEGPNEPNNWGIEYGGAKGGRGESWKPVAALQRDLYKAVHGDPILRRFPVWGISEAGAETDNVGLQFLTVPPGAGTEVPDGTRYADSANVHNYVYHSNSPGLEDDKTWNAADPTPACRVDGLYGNHGSTWAHHYPGYSDSRLLTLPRVTTETGCAIDGPVTEKVHALNLLSLYLDQFKRGWSHTAVYLLRDRVDEAGNQKFGFYRPDGTPRLAARYLHNLTTILAGKRSNRRLEKLAYAIPNRPSTVHDLLLQKGDGTFALVVWSELVNGSNRVTIRLNAVQPTISLYDPTVGTTAIETRHGVDAVDLTLTDHPVVIDLPRA